MRTLFAILLVSCIFAAEARKERTTRPRAKVKTEVSAPVYNDTICADTASIRISGFEKTLRSRWETFFVTNLSSRPVTSLILDMEYLDGNGRQLHRRTGVAIQFLSPLPPGETRQAKIPTWDTQSVRYYHLSPPVRTRAQATPFRVKISPVAIVSPREPTISPPCLL